MIGRCFCCGIKGAFPKIEEVPVCPGCAEETFVIADEYFGVYFVDIVGMLKSYSAQKNEARRYLEPSKAQHDINIKLSAHKRFKIEQYGK